MRHPKDFSIKEWMCLVPLKHALKQTRNDAWLGVYQRTRAKGQEAFLRHARIEAARNIVLVTAFERPAVVDLQLTMTKRHLVDATVYVFDNSIHESARNAISDVCRRHRVGYLALPRHGSRHANRSHGMALGWIYQNIVRALQPELFAFIDHDLIPLRPISLKERIGDQPFYGMPLHSPWAWQLWAGYCIFNLKRVSMRRLNFNYDFSQGLDTGGRNWGPLYRKVERKAELFADSERVRLDASKAHEPVVVQVVDGQRWLHLEGAGYVDTPLESGSRLSAITEMLVGDCAPSAIIPTNNASVSDCRSGIPQPTK